MQDKTKGRNKKAHVSTTEINGGSESLWDWKRYRFAGAQTRGISIALLWSAVSKQS
jgi:hypothetical protein